MVQIKPISTTLTRLGYLQGVWYKDDEHHKMERESNNLNITALTPDTVAFQMIVDEMREIKGNLVKHGDETKVELRRLNDKFDQLRTELRREINAHDRDIVRLETQAQMAGRISGALWGSISGLAVALAAAAVRYMLGA